MIEELKKQLAKEFGLAYWEEDVSAAEWAIMDKLSEIDKKLNTLLDLQAKKK